MRRKSYTDDDIVRAVADCTSIAGVIKKLGLVPAGGNYVTIKNAIRRLGLKTDHFKGQGHSKGKKRGPKRPLSLLLKRNSRIQSYKLKRRLLQERIFKRACVGCDLTEWRGRPIPLELHHKDGNGTNNELSNLELLCPNCHALTENYRGRKIGNEINTSD